MHDPDRQWMKNLLHLEGSGEAGRDASKCPISPILIFTFPSIETDGAESLNSIRHK
jgi:hypothetical protein